MQGWRGSHQVTREAERRRAARTSGVLPICIWDVALDASSPTHRALRRHSEAHSARKRILDPPRILLRPRPARPVPTTFERNVCKRLQKKPTRTIWGRQRPRCFTEVILKGLVSRPNRCYRSHARRTAVRAQQYNRLKNATGAAAMSLTYPPNWQDRSASVGAAACGAYTWCDVPKSRLQRGHCLQPRVPLAQLLNSSAAASPPELCGVRARGGRLADDEIG